MQESKQTLKTDGDRFITLSIEIIGNMLSSLLNDPEFLVKILPTGTQLVLSMVGVSKRAMYHILRRNPGYCDRLEGVQAGPPLEEAMDQIMSIRTFTFELTRLQSTTGLVLTMMASAILSNSANFRFWTVVLAFLTLLGYYWLTDTSYTTEPFDASGRIHSLVCALAGVGIIIVSSSLFL